MKLTAWERQQLAEIERRLRMVEPRLHRALSEMATRPLRRRRTPTTGRPAERGVRLRLALVMIVLGVGLAMLVTGEVMNLVAMAIGGAVLASGGPLLACRLLVRRNRTETAEGREPWLHRRTVTARTPRTRRPRRRFIARFRRSDGLAPGSQCDGRSPPLERSDDRAA